MSSWSELKAEGNDLLNKGDSQGAVDKYTQALQALGAAASSSADQQILFSNRSAAELKSGNFEAALADADQCVQLGPKWAKAYNRRASALKELERLDEAIAACDAGLEIEPGNGPLVGLRSQVLTAQQVQKLHGTWHGNVAEEVGGYMQVFDFLNESDVVVRVLGTTVNAKYELNVTALPFPHLDISVPNSQPGTAFVRHIYRFTDDSEALELCSPYLRPPEERPTEFAGMGLVVMRRGEYVRSAEEEAFRQQMALKSPEERVEEFLRQCVEAVPDMDVRPLESDTDAEVAQKLTANVKFQTFYQSCTDRIGQDTESMVKELMIGDAKADTESIHKLVIAFRNKMFAAGLIAGGNGSLEEEEDHQQQQQQQDVPPPLVDEDGKEDVPAPVAPKQKPVEVEVPKKKKAVAAPAVAAAPVAPASTSTSSSWVPVVAALAVVGVVAALAVMLLSAKDSSRRRD